MPGSEVLYEGLVRFKLGSLFFYVRRGRAEVQKGELLKLLREYRENLRDGTNHLTVGLVVGDRESGLSLTLLGGVLGLWEVTPSGNHLLVTRPRL